MTVIPFPDRPPAPTGYCGSCHQPVSVRTVDAWPQECPLCHVRPFCSVSSPSMFGAIGGRDGRSS